jgi:hypothetical protein
MFKSSVFLRILIASTVVIVTSVLAIAQEKNLSADEIIARHLGSFGSNEAIAKSVNRMAIGSSDFTHFDTSTNANGSAAFASDGKNMAFFSTFNLRDYRMERIGLFQNRVSIPVIYENHRSPLGSFLLAYDKLLTSRLFGGSIFSTWLLYGNDLNGVKIEAEGKKRVENRDAWVLKVSPKGGLITGSWIKLYFDAKDFHHIRTVYHQKETESGFYDTGEGAKNKGTSGNWGPGEMANNGSTLTEDFSDFSNDAAGLSLPHKYSVLLYFDSHIGSAQFKWSFQLTEYKLIRQFPPNFFSFDASALP